MDKTMLTGKKAVYYTLGCKLNFSETSTIARQLAGCGVVKAGRGERADLCVINTCSVTEVADRKCRQAIHRIVRQHPGAYVIVTGCYAQLKPEEVEHIEGVGLVVGAHFKGHVADYINPSCFAQPAKPRVMTTPYKAIHDFFPSCSRGDRTRYFLKVQDGCDYFCTYCTIPWARGRSRNDSIASLTAQAARAAAEGGKEIVITGVNIGDYGKTTGESFLDLLQALDGVEGISRYRISSLEPDLLTDDIIDFVAHSRAFMPHFHIPLQSGSDEVLRLMHRRYDTALFAGKVAYIRQRMPHAFIGVDVIAGSRGETDACFEQTFHFLEGLDVSQLHVFTYSERPDTRALQIEPNVPIAIRHERTRRLIELSGRKTTAFYQQHIGTEAVVLLEKARTGMPMHGFTENYIRIETSAKGLADNGLVRVRLDGFNTDKTALQATIIK